MKTSAKCCLLILAVTIAAFVTRLPLLSQRAMHTDEAVHAEKLGQLLQQGFYRYDPAEYHGPTLNYFTLIPAKLSGINKYTQLTETTLRIVPVFFSAALILLLLLLVGRLPATTLIFVAVFTAISPAFIYYSRYYIQEILLVCFTFGVITSAYRYTKNKNIFWALLTGLFLGMAHATKETFIITFASMLLALFILLILEHRKPASIAKTLNPLHIVVALITAVVVSALFYSSFLTNPAGIIDSLISYTTYLSRACQSDLHIHPPYFYLKMLLFSKFNQGPVWTEALIVILALIGCLMALTKKNTPLIKFFALYTLIMTIVYSAIPYKTPWSMLGFLHAMIIMAGFAAAIIIRSAPTLFFRATVIVLLTFGCIHLGWQGYRSAYVYHSDPVNPYVYAHTSPDIFNIADRIKAVAAIHPDSDNMYIQVIVPDSDYWPLPWYLRNLNNIAWLDNVDPDMPDADLIIASPEITQPLMHKLYEQPAPGQRHLYVPLFESYTELRPSVGLIALVKKNLWDILQQTK